MSNLIKSVYFNIDVEGQHVIDSDSKVERFIPGIKAAVLQEHEKSNILTERIFGEEADKDDLEFSDDADLFADAELASAEVSEDEMQSAAAKAEEEVSSLKEEILNNAVKEAEEIVANAKEEVEVMKTQAYEEGKQFGYAEGNAAAQAELQTRMTELEDEYAAKMQDLEEKEKALEPQFAKIMTGLIEKITGVICEDKKDVITYLIDNALKGLEKTSHITIHASKEDMGVVSSHRTAFVDIAGSEVELDIIEDNSLSANQCIIETDGKVIDCSLDAQLDNLKKQIELIAM